MMIPAGNLFARFREAVRKARVLVVGDVMLDRYWFGDVERISPEAPVPVVKIARTDERPGGAANVARNAAALGAQVTLIGVVGDDEPGRSLERLLAIEHVGASLHRDATLPTTVKLRVIGRQQQLLRVDFETVPSVGALAANAFIGAESLFLLGLEKRGLPVRQALRRIGDLIRMVETRSDAR